MPEWNRTIDLADLVKQYKTDADIPGLAEKIVARIEQSGWLADTPYPDTLRDALNQLKQADCARHYVAAFDLFYDVADEDRVWIETS